jgi:hypothetical protein
MFRESSAIDSERTAKSVGSLYAKYSADENWFSGSPDSVDRRIAQAKKISNLCKAASVRLSGRNASSQYIALAREMDGDRADLEGLRRDLLTAAADRDEATSVDELIGPPYAEDYQDKFEDRGDKEIPPGLRELLGRSEARHFIAEQECDDLRELTIRAQNYAERTASSLPASQYRAFVASFVDAVRNEYRVAARDYSYDHYMEYARRNGLHPGDSLTVDRYSRENSVPQERASAYAMQFNKSANIKTASATDFPAEFMYME